MVCIPPLLEMADSAASLGWLASSKHRVIDGKERSEVRMIAWVIDSIPYAVAAEHILKVSTRIALLGPMTARREEYRFCLSHAFSKIDIVNHLA